MSDNYDSVYKENGWMFLPAGMQGFTQIIAHESDFYLLLLKYVRFFCTMGVLGRRSNYG